MKIAIILGTRPEIIKLSSIIRECQKQSIDFFILHTNQHYSVGMDKVFFDELKLPQPKYNLDVHNLSQGAMAGQMLIGTEPILQQENPDWVLVQGDTNTVMAGAVTASKLGINVGHIEAGLRSYDRTMPEEINRVLTDHVSDALFCPTPIQAKILEGEGIDKDKIFVTGNTIVEAVNDNLKLASSLKSLTSDKYLLLTLHRPSNVDSKDTLTGLIHALEGLSSDLNLPIYYPLHPRTEARLKEFKINVDTQKIHMMPPVGYLAMLKLESEAELILTDSGGVQEEACVLKVPCVTLRDNTERPETIEVGANLLYGGTDKLEHSVTEMINKVPNWSNPFGDGSAAKQIINIIIKS